MSTKVSVGPTSVAGWSSTVTGLVVAVVSLVSGDHTQATVGAVVGGSLAIASLLVTSYGRYAQAQALSHVAPTSVTNSFTGVPDVTFAGDLAQGGVPARVGDPQGDVPDGGAEPITDHVNLRD